MSGICGWTNNQLSLESSSSILNKMASELLINPKHSTKWDISLDFGLAAVGLRQNSDIETDNDSVMVAIQGDVHWLDDELEEALIKLGPARTVQQAFIKNGIHFLSKLSGSFSLCIIDVVHRRSLIAIDKLGISSLFFTVANNQLVFGSNARAILKYPHMDGAINSQGVFDYLYFHMVPSPRCIFNNIEKLLPGEYLLFENNKTIRNFYWQATYNETQNINLKILEQEFLEILESSIRRAAHDTKTGAFLSGGTDSSTISGMLRKIKNEPIDTYSIGFDAEGFDETKFARIAARHFDTKPHEYYLKPQDVVDAIPLIVKAYDEPFGNASAVPAYYCAKHAHADGLNTLLAGDGGDEIFGGNERYVKQKVFELYHQIPDVLRRFLIEPAAFNFPLADKIWPISKAQNYISQAMIPLPDRLETYNLLNRMPLANIFENDFLADINVNEPADFLRQTYNRLDTDSTLNKMLSLDLKFTLADNDLRKVNRMCELGQMEVRYPFLDEQFIQFSSQLPVSLKIHGFKLRYFFKHALKGFLPTEILHKRKQGFGLPFGVWMNTYQPLSDLAIESNLALSRRGIIKPEFIYEIQRLHKQYPGYYGVMIWVFMMLEQWMQNTV
jgi:asparagine synthase (glutamine-hydrolysing)